MRNVGIGWFLILLAFLIFLIGAIVTGDSASNATGDSAGVSFHNSPLVIQGGLAVYMLALLVGGWFAAPA